VAVELDVTHEQIMPPPGRSGQELPKEKLETLLFQTLRTRGRVCDRHGRGADRRAGGHRPSGTLRTTEQMSPDRADFAFHDSCCVTRWRPPAQRCGRRPRSTILQVACFDEVGRGPIPPLRSSVVRSGPRGVASRRR
jgi:hypothetical protein